MEVNLGSGFCARSVSREEYDAYRKDNEPLIFPNRFDIHVQEALSESELEAQAKLAERFAGAFELRVGFFKDDEMIGWSYGYQTTPDTFRMATSGIRQEYQRRGLYSGFLTGLAEHLKREGFQIIFSRHYATDNQVIIPKLRFGFLITGFELTDEFGLLLRLSYYFNETRKKALHVRSGFQQMDGEIEKLVRKY